MVPRKQPEWPKQGYPKAPSAIEVFSASSTFFFPAVFSFSLFISHKLASALHHHSPPLAGFYCHIFPALPFPNCEQPEIICQAVHQLFYLAYPSTPVRCFQGFHHDPFNHKRIILSKEIFVACSNNLNLMKSQNWLYFFSQSPHERKPQPT